MMRRIGIVLVLGLLVASMGVQAWAKGPPEVSPVEFQIQLVNPCTGEEATAFFDGEVRVHQFYNEDGDIHHFNILGMFDVTTSDGFVGRDLRAETHNAEGPFAPTEEEEWGMQMSVENGFGINPITHQVIRAHFTLHLTYRDFEFIVNTESVSLKCLGQPA